MKKSIVFVLFLVFFLLSASACNTFDSLKQNEDIGDSTIDVGLNNTSEYGKTDNDANINEPPNLSYIGLYDSIVVHNEPVDKFIEKVNPNNTGKLSKYSANIASTLIEQGFSEPREIAYERKKDEKGNYLGFESLSLTYHDPECPKDSHGACRIIVDIRILDISPVSIDDMMMIKESGNIEVYKYNEPTVTFGENYKIKIGEYAACYLFVPDTVTDEKEEEILDKIASISAPIRQDLLETSPEIINGK